MYSSPFDHVLVRFGLAMLFLTAVAGFSLAFGTTTASGSIEAQHGDLVEVTNFSDLNAPQLSISSRQVFHVEVDGEIVDVERMDDGVYSVEILLKGAVITVKEGDEVQISVAGAQFVRRADPQSWVFNIVMLALVSFLFVGYGWMQTISDNLELRKAIG